MRRRPEEELTSLLPLVDYTNVQYDEVTGEVILPAGMEIDLGSIAKGYSASSTSEALPYTVNSMVVFMA